MVTDSVARPPIVAWLGYGGLLPFAALALLTCIDHERGAFWYGNLRAYGAVILSFVGALHWGFATVSGGIGIRQRRAMFMWSVIPCLIAFLSLALKSLPGDILLVCGFLAHYWRDEKLTTSAPLPAWYLPLRLQLTAIAILCVAAGAIATRW